MRRMKSGLLAFVLVVVLPRFALAQAQHDPAAVIAAQAEAMKVFSAMDGVWRGPAWTLQPNGEKRHITQTERIGAFLAGSVKVIEGRGYTADGKVGFNAFGIISYNAATRAYSLRSYALGHSGDFAFTPTADGYAWEIPAGPGATIKYTATIRDGTLREVGDRVVADRPPLRVFEMELKRIGDTSWPSEGAVPPG
jgi:hypothetical protein